MCKIMVVSIIRNYNLSMIVMHEHGGLLINEGFSGNCPRKINLGGRVSVGEKCPWGNEMTRRMCPRPHLGRRVG